MTNKYLIIKLTNTKIDLSNSVSLGYDKTNLLKEAFQFKTNEPLFWKLEQKAYDSASAAITVAVVDYNLAMDTVLDQAFKSPIESLIFETLDWEKFNSLLYSYNLSPIKKNPVFNYRNKLLDLNDEKSEELKLLRQTAPNLFYNKREPIRKEINIELKVKYEDAKFETSKICFSVNLKPYKHVEQCEIINPNLRPEFEYIKPFFVKRMGKTFLAKIRVKLSDNKIENLSASSDEIANIDEKVINLIKASTVLGLKHFQPDREEKIIYNIKELSIEDKKLLVLNGSINDILEIFIENAKVRNVTQLEYLARDRQSLNDRVLFTIKPLFGFIFHEFNHKECFIWELLNSHATYIWKSRDQGNTIDLEKVVREAIATIKNEGRETYKKYFKNLNNPGYHFTVLNHSSTSLTNDEGFNQWRNKLEKFCL